MPVFSRIHHWIYLLAWGVLSSGLFAQGLPRSIGLGVRSGFWRAHTVEADFNLGSTTATVSEGAGTVDQLYVFSRIKDNWFFESTFGSDGGTQFASSGTVDEESGKAAIVPVLFGARYDWLPERYGSIFQPYVSAGTGFYFISQSVSWVDFGDVTVRISQDKQTLGGIYAGAGLHIVLRSWLALNVDIKYHAVNFRVDKGYSGIEIAGGLCFLWGKKREIFRVEDVRVIVQDIYPAYYQFYNTYPIAMVTVRNTTSHSIEVNIKSNIKGYSERTQASGFQRIDRGQTRDIPVYALFGQQLMQTERREPAVIDLELEARAGSVQIRTFSASIMIHQRNAWNGDIDKLSFFVTPDEDEILAVGREVTRTLTDSINSTSPLIVARSLFQHIQNLGVRYHRDPNIPYYQDDRVQFAGETMDLQSGDCDDLVVLYASLLESAGISTAFVDVQDPTKTVAHVYLMFDTGLPPDQNALVSSNEKRYVIRENASGMRSIWIPVEITMLDAGFDAAWASGATQYLQEGVLNNGLSAGWVRVFDVK